MKLFAHSAVRAVSAIPAASAGSAAAGAAGPPLNANVSTISASSSGASFSSAASSSNSNTRHSGNVQAQSADSRSTSAVTPHEICDHPSDDMCSDCNSDAGGGKGSYGDDGCEGGDYDGGEGGGGEEGAMWSDLDSVFNEFASGSFPNTQFGVGSDVCMSYDDDLIDLQERILAGWGKHAVQQQDGVLESNQQPDPGIAVPAMNNSIFLQQRSSNGTGSLNTPGKSRDFSFTSLPGAGAALNKVPLSPMPPAASTQQQQPDGAPLGLPVPASSPGAFAFLKTASSAPKCCSNHSSSRFA